MIANNAAFIYETLYNRPFEITKCQTNGMVTFQYCAEDKGYNIHLNILYKYETNVEDIFAENDVLQHDVPLYISVYIY